MTNLIKNNGDATSRMLEDDCSKKMTRIQSLRNEVVSDKPTGNTHDKIGLLNEINLLLDNGLGLAGLYESVHPCETVRNTSERMRQSLSKLSSDLELDRDLYEVVARFEQAGNLDSLTQRFIAHTIRDFRRAGVDKDEESRQKIARANERLVALSQQFGRNIRSDSRKIELDSKSQLKGLPQDYIDSHPPDSQGRITISTDYPDLMPFMSYATSGTSRQRLQREYHNRAYPDNMPVLREILELRHELAVLLGYPNWASYITEDKMIGSADSIRKFIEDIEAVAKSRGQRDKEILLERKRKDDSDATEIFSWEHAYYAELVRCETLDFDSQEIRSYLEYNKVKQGLLEVTQRIFDLEYRKIDETAWHESVETYEVFSEGKCIGVFHLDMHPREGKYKHAAMFPIASGVRNTQRPRASLVCNFPDPASAKGPALMEHRDVVTFFHEFGHLLHHILGGNQKYLRFSGIATEWDFVEVPSQLLEEWAYDYISLSSFATHVDTGACIPEELVERLNHARSFGRGVGVLQQLFYAALALNYHDRSPEEYDSTELLKELQQRYSPFPHEEGTHMQASFGHLDGYSALYYTYMWSLVIAKDLFSIFEAGDLFDTKLAVKYRMAVLNPGGSADATELIRGFLGRDYNLNSYREWISKGE